MKLKTNLTLSEDTRRMLALMAAEEKRSWSNLVEMMTAERWAAGEVPLPPHVKLTANGAPFKRSTKQSGGKPRIRQNAYGNWYGYIGNEKVMWFYATALGETQEEQAKAWLDFHLKERSR